MVCTYHRNTEKVPREILIGALRHLKLLNNLKWQQSKILQIIHLTLTDKLSKLIIPVT